MPATLSRQADIVMAVVEWLKVTVAKLEKEVATAS
jgi:hypothetical protein